MVKFLQHNNKTWLLLVLLIVYSSAGKAQLTFNTGNGIEGVFHATTNTSITGGVHNFTDFIIDAGVTVNVTGSSPLEIRCTGLVLIDGVLQANGGNGANGVTYSNAGNGGLGIAGGADGGNGSYSSSSGPIDGVDGAGPGGSNNRGKGWSGGGGAGFALAGQNAHPTLTNGVGGPSYSSSTINDLPKGSGGGGGSGGYDCGAGGGGAGGGLIIIHAANSITISATGAIHVDGGNGGSDGTGNCGGGGGGSAGTIWLAAPSYAQAGTLSAVHGVGGSSTVSGSPYWGGGANGSEGRIRVDYNGPIVSGGTSLPAIGYHTSIANIPLAVMLNSFTGDAANNHNFIQWTSSNEINNSHYILQYSTDAINFSTIQTIPSKAIHGNSATQLNYEYTHQDIHEGHNYYRLIQVDIDGKSTIAANIIDVLRGNVETQIDVFPNPVQTSLSVRLNLREAQHLNIQLVDVKGQIIWEDLGKAEKGIWIKQFDTQELSAGIYTLVVFSKNRLISSRQIYKN